MQAIVQTKYGEPEDLGLREIEAPTPRDDEALVRVRASSVHADIWHVIAGHPRFLRLMGNGLRRPASRVPGTDLAGTIVAIGAGVTSVAVGDEVFGETLRGHQWKNGGAWAQLATAPAARLARKPANVSFVDAAVVPTTGLIALDLLHCQAQLVDGDRVLVNGAGGAVGTLVVQVARAHGCHVTAVDSHDKLDLLRSLGAAEVIDYAERDFTTSGERYDVIIDIPGNHPWKRLRACLTPAGRYVLVGHDGFDHDQHRWFGAMRKIVPLMLRAIWSPHLPGPRRGEPVERRMMRLQELLERGAIRPVVAREYPLAEAPAAVRHLMSGAPVGRIVLTVE